ncbi:MAG: T9SS type A sorting domain-containing protein [Ignavibacteria bacterium]|nr:T9SS type A sorting domain-containing protein [Ignavibacteria bacterium]
MKSIAILFLVVAASLQVLYAQSTDEYGTLLNNGILRDLGNPGSYCATEHNSVLNFDPQGTIEAWVYLTSYNENHSIIYMKSTFSFMIGNSALGHRPFLNINSSSFFSPVGDSVPLNRWVHLAASWQHSGAQTTVTFFVDGLLYGSPITQVHTIANNTDSVTIGGSSILPTSSLHGYIDEVRFWSRARIQNEIARTRFVGIGDAPFSNQSSSLVSNEDYTGLVSSWTFNKDTSVFLDNISGRHLVPRGGVEAAESNITCQPIPYNLAAHFPGNANDYIRVADNNAFDLTAQGTIDGWIYVMQSPNAVIISKGASPAANTFRLLVGGPNNSLTFQIGNFGINGPNMPGNTWNHFAVSWAFSGGNCSIRFFVNGIQYGPAVNPMTMPLNADPLYIGNSQSDNLPFKGYMDELRIWSRALTNDEIKAYTFVSAKQGGSFIQNNLIAHWGLDGDLNNSTGTSGLNGTFNNSLLNKCRFSGYLNENITGPVTNSFIPHCTSLNKLGDNSFPGGFSIRTPDKTLPNNVNTYDTINVPGNVSLSNIEVFLSVNQPNINSSTITLRAPNGTERTLLSGNGGTGGHVLTFFRDGETSLSSFNSPWSYTAAPNQVMGNFGGTNVQGNWILRMNNTSTGNTGKLLGWGIRINNTLTAINEISNNIPGEFMLYQNYPNPFNPETNIRFDIPNDADVKITLFDMLGREVQVIANEFKHAGSYEVKFDASHLSSGTYFYKLTAGSFTDIKKIVLIK